jgi:hypothetical protein
MIQRVRDRDSKKALAGLPIAESMVLNKDKDRSSQQSRKGIDSDPGGLSLARRAVPSPESGDSARGINVPQFRRAIPA